MHSPLVGSVISLMLGMLAAQQLGLPAWMHGVLAFCGLAAVGVRGGSIEWRLRFAGFLVGAWLFAAADQRTGPRELMTVAPEASQLGTLRGWVTDPGEPRTWTNHTGVHQSLSMEMRTSEWRRGDGSWVCVEGWVRVHFRNGAGVAPLRGQRCEVSGVLREAPGPELPGGFDYRAHLRMRGIDRLLECEDAHDWNAGEAPKPGWSDRFIPWAHQVLSAGLPDDAAGRLIRAMVLGWRGGLDEEWREPFLRSGTLHVFAISGLHIALVVGLVVQALRLLRVNRAWCGAVVIPVAWFYVAATGWQASAVRSAVMSSVLVCGWALNRPSDLLNTLAVSAALILAWDPGQLFQPGFQLSFGVVAGMALWGNVLERCWTEWTSGTEGKTPEGVSIWQRWRTATLRWLGLNLATSAAAWMASLPLCVHYFHLVSPSSLVANLVVVPLSSLCLVAGVASMAVAPVWGGLSEWFNQSAWFWMQWMMRAGVASSELPLAYQSVEAPAWGWWTGYVWWVFVVGPAWARTRRVDWKSAVPVAAWALASMVAWTSHYRTERLVCLPWGAGVLVEPGAGRRVLFDVGSAAVARRTVPDWLKTRGLGRLDAGVACSGEVRFAGGWPQLFEAMPVRDWWMGPGNTPALKKAHEAALEKHVPIHRLVAGRGVEGWETLWPPSNTMGSRSDDRALVLRATFSGMSCVLMPSLNPEAQRAWLETVPVAMRTTLLIVGLPTRGEPAIDEVLDRLQPECIVVLADTRSPRHRMSDATRRRLRRWGLERGTTVWFTDECGAVTVTIRRPWVFGDGQPVMQVDAMRPDEGRDGADGGLENKTDRER